MFARGGVWTGGLASPPAPVVSRGAAAAPRFKSTLIVAGSAAALIQPGQQAAFADILGRDRSGGQALATYSMAGDLGGFLGPIATGLLADAVGFGWAFALSGLVLLVASLPWWFAADTLQRRAD